jgi:hypothetical protein
MNVVIAVSSKEGVYLKDWVEWHLAIGFDHIFLYDACDDYETFKAVMPYCWQKKLTLIPAIGKPIQWEAYSHCINSLQKSQVDWAWIADIDEMLVLKKETHISGFLAKFKSPDIGSIVIPWSCFGANGHGKFEDVPVWTRFTTRVDYEGQHPHDRHTKSFVRPRAVSGVGDPHVFPMRPDYKRVDSNMMPVKSSQNKWNELDDSQAVVNHYVTKSLKEWIGKSERGSADINHFRRPKRSLQEFHQAQLACNRVDNCALDLVKRLQKQGKLNAPRYILP